MDVIDRSRIDQLKEEFSGCWSDDRFAVDGAVNSSSCYERVSGGELVLE
jgi:hypothetical protein